MELWFLLMIAVTTGLVFGGEVPYFKWAAGGWLLHHLGDSFGSSPWMTLNLFIFLLRLGGRNFGPRMMQAWALCPILPQHSKIIFCFVRIAPINGWIDDLSLLMEDRVKFSSRLQRLKQSYLLTYYQKDWSDRTKNNPWSYLLKYHSFTAYCAYNTNFYLVCMRIRSFVRMPLSPVSPSVNLHVFGPCSSVRMPLSPVR